MVAFNCWSQVDIISFFVFCPTISKCIKLAKVIEIPLTIQRVLCFTKKWCLVTLIWSEKNRFQIKVHAALRQISYIGCIRINGLSFIWIIYSPSVTVNNLITKRCRAQSFFIPDTSATTMSANVCVWPWWRQSYP